MTFNDLWGHTSFHKKICILKMLAFKEYFHQNRFINKSAIKYLAKIAESLSHVVFWDVEEPAFFIIFKSKAVDKNQKI